MNIVHVPGYFEVNITSKNWRLSNTQTNSYDKGYFVMTKSEMILVQFSTWDLQYVRYFKLRKIFVVIRNAETQ